ncbi:anaerobic ribonucleoside-triphosphate reductase activating protein [Desulfatibacillum aliphaticivorans]|uniref:Anaerobic ribonucleoside-triphosphate reductase activating protein n=1 Tax=Desulfatibacillum aliphaticivorans TaxID=218208 RepID=B8FIL3_DESAL|nr:anaerobic ribonucleoside-triphosphate reductase activating protein [Desulfatibacillum aliphaticivorans]ACL04003.1 anaerobic ribonucleoside-triphosphate reductase activating protein [Desulfatibacillum aliphaticivorans]
MVFGGIQKTSLIDFPGRVGCVLFTAGCNFKCPYCHNPELLSFSTAQVIKNNWVMSFLKERKGFLDGVVITGGEPTLHKDLMDFMAAIKDMGFELKLDTNGSRPGVLGQILEKGLADYVAMDLKTDPALYAEMVASPVEPEKIRTSIQTILDSGTPHEFRTTCAHPMIDADILAGLMDQLSGADLWVFQECQGTRMLEPDFLEKAEIVYTREDVEAFAAQASSCVKEVRVR